MTTFNNSGDTGNNGGSNNSQGSSFQGNQEGDNPQGNAGNGGNSSDSVDVNKLSKRLDDSQEFINTLKSERQADRDRIQELEAKLNEAPSMEKIMEELSQRNQGSNDNIDPDTLVSKAAEQVRSQMTAEQAQEREENNFNQVAETLSNKFGADNVDSKVAELAKDNDMTFDEVVEMARKSPKATLKLLGVSDDVKPTPSGPNGSVNSQALGKTGDEDKSLGNITKLRSDRDRINLTKQFFEKNGIDFNY